MRAPRPSLVFRLAWILMFTCAACSVERHYRTLSFFFDGVPDPNAPPPEPEIVPGPLQGPTLAPAPADDGSSLHPPVRERRCHECHLIPERTAGAGWQAGLPELVAPREELCRRCHEPPSAAHVHGPAGSGRCDLCHLPHQSSFPHLLRQERQESLCRACHEGELFTTAERHAGFGARDCIACHDPHGSELAALLRPGHEAEQRDAEAGR